MSTTLIPELQNPILDFSKTAANNPGKKLYGKLRSLRWEGDHHSVDDLSRYSPSDRAAAKLSLGWGITLDSIQTHAVPLITRYVEDPWLRLCCAEHLASEAVHNVSYSMVSGTLEEKEQAEVYSISQENRLLKQRVASILEPYSDAIADPSDPEKRIIALMADYLLEGVLFPHVFCGFAAMEHLFPKSLTHISLIAKDEDVHTGIFALLIREHLALHPSTSQQLMLDVAMKIAAQELDFLPYLLPTLDPGELKDSLNWLMASRLKAIGLEYPTKQPTQRPFKELWAAVNAGQGEVGFRCNTLEIASSNYVEADTLSWEGF